MLLLSAAAHGAPATAIQERRYKPQHELSFGVGLLPLDPFTKGLTASFGYTLHLSDELAWRLAEVAYSAGLRTNLRRDLQSNFAVKAERFAQAEIIATSDLVWAPLYGKESFLNRGALWSSTSLSLGGGVVVIREGEERTPAPAASSGIGLTLFVSDAVSVRLDARMLFVVTELALPDRMAWLTLTGSWSASQREGP